MRIIKRISKKSAKLFVKLGSTIYSNDKIQIHKKYGEYSSNFKEILEAFETLIVGIGNILYSFILLIIALIGFIPTIYIIDKSIDEKENRKQEEIDKEMRKRFNKERGIDKNMDNKIDGSRIISYSDDSFIAKIKQLQEENNLLKQKEKIFWNLVKSQIEMFESADEKDGKHTLVVNHDSLMKLKNKYIEVLGELQE